MPWQRRDAPILLFAAALAASALLLIVLSWHLTFFQDTWAFLLERRGSSVGDFLRPHNEHLVVIPVIVTKVCEQIFGLSSAHPEMFVMTATLLAAGAVLFVYVRRRLGPWLALLAVLPVLFIGSSWMILLWPFEIDFSGGVMAGLGAMLLLERRDRRADVWACLLLIVSIGFGSLGLSFAVAAAVVVWQSRSSLGWSRGYVVVVPAVLYLIWYLGWGHTAEHHLTLQNILEMPRFVLDGLAQSVASLVGLNVETEASTAEPIWGRGLLLALIAAAVAWQRRRRFVSPRFWPAAAAAASYWVLAAFNYIPGREAASNRYVYAGVIFLVMMLSDLLDGVRVGRRGLAVLAIVVACALAGNIALLKEGSEVFETQGELTRADTAALEIARRTVPPDMVMDPSITGTLANVTIIPGPYLEVTDEHGSPAYTPEELTKATPLAQHWADVLLASALPLSLKVVPSGSAGTGGRCSSVGGESPPELELGPGTYTVAAGGAEAHLHARRYSVAEFPVDLGTVPAGETAKLGIPRDEASQPWHLQVESTSAVRICR